jgi:hypothetical protein
MTSQTKKMSRRVSGTGGWMGLLLAESFNYSLISILVLV